MKVFDAQIRLLVLGLLSRWLIHFPNRESTTTGGFPIAKQLPCRKWWGYTQWILDDIRWSSTIHIYIIIYIQWIICIIYIYKYIYIIYSYIYIRIYPMFIEFNSCHGTPFWMAAAASSNGSGWVAWPFKAALHHQKWWISPWFSHGFMGWSWHQKWDGFSHCFMGCFSQSDQFFPSKSGCVLKRCPKSDMSQVGGPGGDRDAPFLRPMGAPRIGPRILTWHWWKTWWIFGWIFGDIV